MPRPLPSGRACELARRDRDGEYRQTGRAYGAPPWSPFHPEPTHTRLQRKTSANCDAKRLGFVGARDGDRTRDPQLGKRGRTRGTATTYALTTGIWRRRAAYRGTQDGSQRRKRHPRGTSSEQVGAPPAPVGGLTPPPGSAEKQKGYVQAGSPAAGVPVKGLT